MRRRVAMKPKLVKRGAYVSNGQRLFRIEAVRDVGKRREILIENSKTETQEWMSESFVLTCAWVCQGDS